ncbi:MAG: hypothetical protein MI861_08465, partial [Pirellulales bacterium]|nr:hypothetical protein [Pirellulales bacterium]
MVEQIVDGPSMMTIGNATAQTDHFNESVMSWYSGTMSFFCDLTIASNVHPAGAKLLCALKCECGWNHGQNMFFMLDCFWTISGPISATVYSDGSNVCVDYEEIVDYMGMPFPQPVTICSANSIWDPVGSLYVDLVGEGRVGDSVIMSGHNNAATLSAGGMLSASGENHSVVDASIVNGLCWMQLGDFVP